MVKVWSRVFIAKGKAIDSDGIGEGSGVTNLLRLRIET